MSKETEFYLERHLSRGHLEKIKQARAEIAGKEAKELSEKAILEAEETVDRYLEIIEKSPKNTVAFFSFISDRPRARESSQLQEIVFKERLKEKPDLNILLFDSSMYDPKSESFIRALQRTSREKENINKRIAIFQPLYLKELKHHEWFGSPEEDNWIEEHGGGAEDPEVMDTNALKNWFDLAKQSKLPENMPDPEKAADTIINGLKRAKEFSEKVLPERPKKIVLIGHGWEADVALAKLSGLPLEGKTIEKYFGDREIKKGEFATIRYENERPIVEYREKTFKSE